MASDKQFKIQKVVQVGYVVRDAEKVSKAWTELFGFTWNAPHIVDGKDPSGPYKGVYHKEKLMMTNVGDLVLELVQPMEGKALHAEFLEKNGEGVQHIQVRTGDVEGEATKLASQGAIRVLNVPKEVAYMANLPGGLVLEIVAINHALKS